MRIGSRLPALSGSTVRWSTLLQNEVVVTICVSVVLLIAIGLVVLGSLTFSVYSDASRAVFMRQLAALGLAGVVFLLTAGIDYRFWKSAQWILFCLALLFLLAVLWTDPIRGSRAWLSLGNVTLQASEFAKFPFLVFLAWYASRWSRQMRRLKHLLATLLGTAMFALLVFFEPDIGSSSLFLIVWISFILTIGLSVRQLFSMGLSALVLLAVLWFGVFAPYQKERVRTFLVPSRDPRGSGYNLRQSLTAIGSGGWFGKGFAQGSQSQLRYLPEAHSDFVFAVVAESFGLFGVGVVLGLWAVVFAGLFFLLPRLVDDFAQFYCLALILLLFWETTVPIAINLGLLPVTGLALPLLAAGGSSLVVHLGMFGVLLNIVKQTPLRLRDPVMEVG